MGLLSRIFGRADNQPEQRGIVSYNGTDTSGAWLWNDRISDAGITVNRNTALGLDTVYAGVRMVANDVGKLPLKVFSRSDGVKQPAEQHPSYSILHDYPNPDMGSFTFKQTIMAHAMLTGNGYAWIERLNGTTPQHLWILDPDSTWPARVNGVLYYQTSGRDGRPIVMMPDDVMHIRNLSHEGVVGYSVIELLVNALGGAMATRKFANTYFENNGRPSVVIEFPIGKSLKTKEAVEQFRASWANLHGGIANSHRPAILEDGAKLSDVRITAEDAQLIAKAEFDVRTVANIIGIPPHKLGDSSRTAYNSIEAENRSYLDGINGWLVCWEQECTRKLLRIAERNNRTHFIEFVRDAFLQADKKTERELLRGDINDGLLTLNEGRSILNLPAYDYPEANIPRMPANQILINKASEPDPVPNPPQEPDATPDAIVDDTGTMDEMSEDDARTARLGLHARAILGDTLRRMAGRLAVHAERAAKKPEIFLPEVYRLREKHAETVLEALEKPLNLAFELTGSTNTTTIRGLLLDDFEQAMVEAAECQRDQLADNVTLTLAGFNKRIEQYENMIFGSTS